MSKLSVLKVVVCLTFFTGSYELLAQWPSSTFKHLKIHHSGIMIEDGEGGFYNAQSGITNYADNDNTIQRVSADGTIIWEKEFFHDTPDKHVRPHRIIKDKDNNLFILVTRYAGQGYELYVFKLDKNGNHLWSPDGVLVKFNNLIGGDFGNMAVTEEGGVFVSWVEYGILIDQKVFIQKLNADGGKAWGDKGLILSSNLELETFDYWGDNMFYPDGQGGCYVTWQEVNPPFLKRFVMLQHVNASGAFNLGPVGKVINEYNGSLAPSLGRIFKNSFGELFVFWPQDYKLYGQKLDDAYQFLWGPLGKEIVPLREVNSAGLPFIQQASDGGFFVHQYDDSYNHSINRIDRNGDKLWGDEGAKFTNLAKILAFHSLREKNGSLFVAWGLDEDPSGTRNLKRLYVQKLDYDGNMQWGDGIKLCEYEPVLTDRSVDMGLVPDGVGGAFVGWPDVHGLLTDGNHNQFQAANRVFSGGTLGNTPVTPAADPGLIQGTSTICTGINSFSVQDVSPGTIQWILQRTDSPGLKRLTGNNQVSFDFTEPGSYDLYAVPYSQDGVPGPASRLEITVNPSVKVTEIKGNPDVCLAYPVEEYYVIKPIKGPPVSYSWEANGGTVVEDSGNGVKVEWTESDAATITVTPLNGCHSGEAVTLQVSTTVMPTVSNITGPSMACAFAAEPYSIVPISDATIEWVPESGSVLSGQGTPQAQISINYSQDIVVRAIRGPCYSPKVTLHVSTKPRPDKPNLTAAFSELCVNRASTLAVVGDYSGYEWNNGATTKSITLTQPGTFRARVKNELGCWSVMSESSTASKPTAVLTINDDELTASSAVSYDWYLNGSAINEHAQTLTPEESGSYKVKLTTSSGCEVFTNEIPVTITSIERATSPISIFPNPTSGKIQLTSDRAVDQVELSNVMGKKLMVITEFSGALDLSGLPSGNYILSVQSGSKVMAYRIVKL